MAATSLADLIVDFDEDAAIESAVARLAAGEDPQVLVAECRRGMQRVGELYERGEFFISALIMAGEVLREVFEVLGPHLTSDVEASTSGTMVLCTVKGDIHDIGKEIAGTLLTAHGLKIVDLGVDVAPERLADEVERVRPDIVGLSGLLTISFESMKRSVDAVRARTADWERRVPVILGGSPMTQQVCDHAGADAWCTDAVRAVHLIHDLLPAHRTG